VNEIDIIVSGLLCLDFIPHMENVCLDELASPGRLFEVGKLDISTGGAVSNTGLALHQLGVNVRLMATVGDDLSGQVMIAFLKDRDPKLCELITVCPDQPSGYTIVLTPQNADRIFLHNPGSSATFSSTDLDFSLIGKAKLFHLGYPPVLPRLIVHDGEEIENLYREAKATGVVTSMDMTVPDPQGPSGQVNWKRILTRVLPYVDIFLPSIEEILFMLRRADFDTWQHQILSHLTADYLASLADELIGMGSVIVGFKLGEMGFYMQTADNTEFTRLERLPIHVPDWDNICRWSPAYQVDVVGTTGAGDSCYAGFLTALLRGMNPDEATRWACAVGACAVEVADATNGVRSWEETHRRMEANWPSHNMRLPGINSKYVMG
jgi:sugar/nucleoside kinase (ribokinase family)